MDLKHICCKWIPKDLEPDHEGQVLFLMSNNNVTEVKAIYCTMPTRHDMDIKINLFGFISTVGYISVW